MNCLSLRIIGLLWLAAVTASSAAPAWSREPSPDAERRAELRYLLLQDCGSCHGMTLRGGLGPPLTHEALTEKPPEMLVATVLDGLPGTAMPPWRDFLSEDDARWLVKALQRGDFELSTAEDAP